MVPAGLEGDAGQVERDDTEVHAPFDDVLAVLVLPALEERAAAHRRLEAARELDDLVVAEHVRVHPLGRALERRLLDVVVRVVRLEVHPAPQREDELGEDRRPVLATEPLDADPQDRLLDLSLEPSEAEAESQRRERRLPVGREERVDLVLQRLHRVVDVFARLRGRVLLASLWFAHPCLGVREVLREVVGRVGREQLVDPVDRAPAVLAGGDVRDDLCDLSGRRLDRAWRLHLGVADAEALAEHALEIDEAAVRHRGIGVVVEVVVVDLALLVGVRDVRRQHRQADGLADRSGRQIALRVEDVAVLVGVLVHHRARLAQELADRVVDVGRPAAGDVALHAVADVCLGDVVVPTLHEHVLDDVLDLVDLHGLREAARKLLARLLRQALDDRSDERERFLSDGRERGQERVLDA